MNLLDISPDKLCTILRSDPAQGLSARAVLQNRKEFGENTPEGTLFSPKGILKGLFSNVLFCMFFALCLFSLFTANRTVGLVCLTTAFACYAVFYFFCMYKARPLSEARRAQCAKYTVLRDGEEQSVRGEEIVPGDILYVSRKDSIPCDGILLSATDLKVCQVQIDGRAQSTKHAFENVGGDERRRERAILYCGSVVLSGEGVLLVCNTGKNIRKTSLSLKQRKALPRALTVAADYARTLSLGLCGITTLIFLFGTFLKANAFESFFLLCTLSVAALPELCEALTRLALLLPLADLKRRGCLVQNYACLDKLLKTDRILVDSPAYFLDAQIRPSSYFFANYPRSVRELSEGLFTLISYCRICCETKPKKREQMWCGKSSIDDAILRTAPEFGIDDTFLDHSYFLIARTPFEEARGFSAALVLDHGRCYQIMRGRPTEVLDRCTHSLQEKRSVALSAAAKARLYQAADQMAADGEVVVAVARRFWRSAPENLSPEQAEYMTFVGFLTFHTPMRAQSAEAVSACRKNGVELLFCTDNDPDATLGIARNMEFFSEGEFPYVLTGEKVRTMDEVTLGEHLQNDRVFCALGPAGKRAVVLAQKQNEHTVLACTHSSSDILTQEAADVNVVCIRDRKNALVQGADILLTEERFELLPELLRVSRTVCRNSLRILRFSILVMVSLFSTAFFSLFFKDSSALIRPLPALLLGLFLWIFASLSACRDRELTPSISPTGKRGFLNATAAEISLYSISVGLATGGVTALSYLFATLFSCRSAEASTISTVTLFCSVLLAFFSARKTKTLKEPEFFASALPLLCIPLTLSLLALLIFVPTIRTHLGLLLPPALSLLIPLVLCALPLLLGEAFKLVKLRFESKAQK